MLEPQLRQKKEGVGRPKAWVAAATAGTELAAVVLAGLFIGRWLDLAWNSGPWLTAAGAIAGMTIGLYRLIRLAGRG